MFVYILLLRTDLVWTFSPMHINVFKLKFGCWLVKDGYSSITVPDYSDFSQMTRSFLETDTAWKMSKYGVISGPNRGKYGPEITPFLKTLHAVWIVLCSSFEKMDEISLCLVQHNSTHQKFSTICLSGGFVKLWKESLDMMFLLLYFPSNKTHQSVH